MNLQTPAFSGLSLAAGRAILLGALVLTTFCVQRAYAVVSTPNQSLTTLTAGSGGYSAAITLPVANTPIMVSGTTLTVGHRGTGSMQISYALAAPSTVSWAGVHSTGSATAGATTTAPQDDILYVGTGALSIGPALNQIRVHNTQAEGFSVQVVVSMIW